MAQFVDEIDRAFATDPDIDELGVVLSSDENIVLTEHKLGIPMTILKPLFKYSITELHNNREALHQPVNSITPQDVAKVCSLSRAILLVKGDFPPALNARKIMIEHGYLCAQREIQFLNVVFSKHPKSPSAWHHRRWCLQRLFGVDHAEDDDTGVHNVDEAGKYTFLSVVALELALCERMCDLYPRNYYSWNHRLWLAQQMSTTQQLEDEYDKISEWLKRHVSDHSAINHQHQVTLLLMKVAATTLDEPSEYTANLLKKNLCESMYVLHSSGSGGHASLWNLRRLWVQTLLSLVQQIIPSNTKENKLTYGGFDVCFDTKEKGNEKVACMLSDESSTLAYHSKIQGNVLSSIVDNFNANANANSDDDDSYIGLSSSHLGSVEIEFSPIEIELELPKLLQDGVTYCLPGTPPANSIAHDNEQSVSIDEDSGTDEVTASLDMHCARFSALLQGLVAIQHTVTMPGGSGAVDMNQLLIWLFKFVTEELLFIGTCISTSGWYTSNCWDPVKQKTCALEYCSFMIYQVLHFMKFNEVDSLVAYEDKDDNCSQRSLASKSMTLHFTELAELLCKEFFQEGMGHCAGKMRTALLYMDSPGNQAR